MAPDDAIFHELERFLPALLTALEAIGGAQRHLHPSHLQALERVLRPHRDTLQRAHERFANVVWEDDPPRAPLEDAARETLAALDGFLDDAHDREAMMRRFRALRRQVRAMEALYPLHAWLKPVSRFFLEESARNSEALLESIRAAATRAGEDASVGVIHYANERENRGGFSLYVPEYWEPQRRWPLVVALHGGSGHGHDFLWTWLREARTRGFIVMSPTARDRTWSIIDPDADVDCAPLLANVAHVMQRWNVDPAKVLLTGMSDGATYAMLHGLAQNVPYTHLAALSGVFHPANMINGNLARARGKPIYVVHGMMDWMFPIDVARMTRAQLSAAGADLVYREIPDLSHTYAREENPRIVEWFAPRLTLPV